MGTIEEPSRAAEIDALKGQITALIVAGVKKDTATSEQRAEYVKLVGDYSVAQVATWKLVPGRAKDSDPEPMMNQYRSIVYELGCLPAGSSRRDDDNSHAVYIDLDTGKLVRGRTEAEKKDPTLTRDERRGPQLGIPAEAEDILRLDPEELNAQLVFDSYSPLRESEITRRVEELRAFVKVVTPYEREAPQAPKKQGHGLFRR